MSIIVPAIKGVREGKTFYNALFKLGVLRHKSMYVNLLPDWKEVAPKVLEAERLFGLYSYVIRGGDVYLYGLDINESRNPLVPMPPDEWDNSMGFLSFSGEELFLFKSVDPADIKGSDDDDIPITLLGFNQISDEDN